MIVRGADERLPDTSAVRVSDGASLEIDGITETIDGLRNHPGSVILSNGATLKLNPTTLRTFPGTLSGAANTSLIMEGTFRQRLTNANSDFFGVATINGGEIELFHVDALVGATVDIQVNDGLDINGLDPNLGALTGSGNLDIGAQIVRIGGNDASPAAYSGVLSGPSGSLVKTGTGTLILSGANTYTGGTTIDIARKLGKSRQAIYDALKRG